MEIKESLAQPLQSIVRIYFAQNEGKTFRFRSSIVGISSATHALDVVFFSTLLY